MPQPPSAGTKVIARRSYSYGVAGVAIDRGQMFKTEGHESDERCERLGYWERAKPKQKMHECGVCNAEFIDERTRALHGEKRHPDRFNDGELVEDVRERESELEERESPLYMDRTRATLEA